MIQNSLKQQAEEFARKAHEHIILVATTGMKWPQIIHLEEVARLVTESGGSEAEIAAAWLHDTVEDTSVTLDDIENEFNKDVRELVGGLTDLDEFKDLPLVERKRKQAERVKSESVGVRRIKLADQTSNVRRMTQHGNAAWTPEEHVIYIHGAKLIADQCRGISDFLDQLFKENYQKAGKMYGF
ncbi:MAG: HD domain-containing protein [Patescibacteria group bacterium]